jgi:hypothetical protein
VRRTHLTLLLALSLPLAQTRPALARAQAAGDGRAATARSEPTKQQKDDAGRVEKLKRVVSKVGVGHRITVFPKSGDDLHGTVSRIGAEDFDVAEVDRKELITVRYESAEKVREGYGGLNLFTGKRASPRKGTNIALLGAVLFVAIGLPLILIGSAKD